MKQIELKALAKINLGLDVLGRRDNGYHNVRMVMQTIYLYDDVKIERYPILETQHNQKNQHNQHNQHNQNNQHNQHNQHNQENRVDQVHIESNLYYLPSNENNIAYKAAKLLIDEFGLQDRVQISLRKRIPVAAGLAGGSANAAAVLYGMNRLFELHLTEEELMERGVKLGADVPYCIMRGTVLAEGIGEELSPLSPMPKCYVLIAKPGISVSTKVVYEKLDSKAIVEHPNIDGIIAGLDAQDLEQVTTHMGNVLEQVTIQDYPVIEKIKDVMKENGAVNAMMSGSGPTVFGIFRSRPEAIKAMKAMKRKKLAKQIYVANIHNNKRRNQ